MSGAKFEFSEVLNPAEKAFEQCLAILSVEAADYQDAAVGSRLRGNQEQAARFLGKALALDLVISRIEKAYADARR